MEISHGLVNLMYFMLCGELNRIKGSRSNKRRKLLTYFTNSYVMYLSDIKSSDHCAAIYNCCATIYNCCAAIYITVAPQLTSKVYNNLSLRETRPEVYNMGARPGSLFLRNLKGRIDISEMYTTWMTYWTI